MDDTETGKAILRAAIKTLRLMQMGQTSFTAEIAGQDTAVTLDAETTNRIWQKMLDNVDAYLAGDF